METIKATILAYMHKSGKRDEKEISVPALDRYLVYVKQGEEYVGGKLLAALQAMLDEGLITKVQVSNILLTPHGQAALAELGL
jgi:hypothetical protein